MLFAIEKAALPEKEQDVIKREFYWVSSPREDITYFTQLWQITSLTREHLRINGIQTDTVQIVADQLMRLPMNYRSAQFAGEVIDFLEVQSAKACPKERLIGSSEIIETLMGCLKHRFGVQSRSGFTSSVLIAPALAGGIDQETVLGAMNATGVHQIQNWHDRYIGKTIQARRRIFFNLTDPALSPKNTGFNGTRNGNIITSVFGSF